MTREADRKYMAKHFAEWHPTFRVNEEQYKELASITLVSAKELENYGDY